MKERSQRLRTIRRVIRGNRINSQEMLLQHLLKEGIAVTQATLSRDLKLLKVGKVSEGADGYYYTLPSDEERRESDRSYVQDFTRGYVSIDFSGNLGVIRTLAGHANSVALALDSLGLDSVLGTVAGDDTVLLVLRENVDSRQALTEMRSKIPDLDE